MDLRPFKVGEGCDSVMQALGSFVENMEARMTQGS